MAEEKGLLLNFEAAVAGGIPVIKIMREALAANSITRVFGILNGTCNYILTRMEQEGLSFEACLADAQRLGYAEADPTFDVEGHDTAHKLSILTSLAFGTQIAVDDIYVEGISNITPADIHAAADLGYRIKLLGVAQRTDTRHRAARAPDHGAARFRRSRRSTASPMRSRSRPTFVGQLAAVRPGRRRQRHGLGGRRRHRRHRQERGRPPACAGLRRPASAPCSPTGRRKMRAHEGGYFIRLSVNDRAGVFAAIASRMAAGGNLAEIDRAAPAAPRRRSGRGRRAAGDPRHPRDDGSGHRQRAEGDRHGRSPRRAPADDPHRELRPGLFQSILFGMALGNALQAGGLFRDTQP